MLTPVVIASLGRVKPMPRKISTTIAPVTQPPSLSDAACGKTTPRMTAAKSAKINQCFFRNVLLFAENVGRLRLLNRVFFELCDDTFDLAVP